MAKGWFTIPGVQAGERKLKERIFGLGTVRAMARGKTVLDLGCAEGLIGKWLVDAGGADLLHGIDKHPPYVEMARQVCAEKSRFTVADFDDEQWAESAGLLRNYDIVLALNIVHKLARPARFLDQIGELATDVLVLSLPSPVIRDHRSGNVPVNCVAALNSFRLIERHDGYVHPTKGHFGIRLIFRRIA